jgi:hypothetical protein
MRLSSKLVVHGLFRAEFCTNPSVASFEGQSTLR